MYAYRVLIRGLGKLHDGLESDNDMGIKDKKMMGMGINKLVAKSDSIIRLLHIILFMLEMEINKLVHAKYYLIQSLG